jgi:hypothetical protein
MVYLDAEKLNGLAVGASASTRAKLGWVLDVKREDWRGTEALLARLSRAVSGGPYYFSSSREPKDGHWVNRWRLYLPYPEQEMAAWLEQWAPTSPVLGQKPRTRCSVCWCPWTDLAASGSRERCCAQVCMPAPDAVRPPRGIGQGAPEPLGR